MATVRVPDAEQPVYPSPNTAGPQATESSAAFCLGRPCGRIWGNCELQRFWVYCTVTPVQENNPANHFQPGHWVLRSMSYQNELFPSVVEEARKHGETIRI